MKTWQLQEAKAQFSDVVRCAQQDGPQGVSVRGKPAAVVISAADYDRLTKQKPRFVDFMRASPLAGTDLKVKRNKTSTRKVVL